MKKKSTSQSAFFNLRVLIAAVFCLGALAVALFAQTKSASPTQQSNRSVGRTGRSRYADARRRAVDRTSHSKQRICATSRYIAPSHEFEEKRLMRYPHPEIPTPDQTNLGLPNGSSH